MNTKTTVTRIESDSGYAEPEWKITITRRPAFDIQADMPVSADDLPDDVVQALVVWLEQIPATERRRPEVVVNQTFAPVHDGGCNDLCKGDSHYLLPVD